MESNWGGEREKGRERQEQRQGGKGRKRKRDRDGEGGRERERHRNPTTFISTFCLLLKPVLFGVQLYQSSFLISLLKIVNCFHGPADKSSQNVGFCRVVNG